MKLNRLFGKTSKSMVVRIMTIVAMIALLAGQGIWLSHTYTLLHNNLVSELDEGFARAIEREIFLRMDHYKATFTSGKIEVHGAAPDKDFYSNALAFHEFLLTNNFPFSLETLDSLWSQNLARNVGQVNYILQITDTSGQPVSTINRNIKALSPYTYKTEKPLRNDRSEYIQTFIESPYKIVINRMTVLLVASLCLVVLLGFSLYSQTAMIRRQERIIDIRQDFTHTMIHDMKTPITNILFGANVLEKNQWNGNEEIKKRYFAIIHKESNHLLAFTNKILTIAQFEGLSVHLTKKMVDLKEMVGGLTEEYLLNASKEIQFEVDMEETHTIHADPEYMQDVLKNLFDNAIKYSGQSVTIHVKTVKDKKNTLIKIRDNGIGIPPGEQKRIFKKFERIRSQDKEKKSGFGLGLYYVHLIVKAHGGKVKVESVPDRYSEFTIQIPESND